MQIYHHFRPFNPRKLSSKQREKEKDKLNINPFQCRLNHTHLHSYTVTPQLKIESLLQEMQKYQNRRSSKVTSTKDYTVKSDRR